MLRAQRRSNKRCFLGVYGLIRTGIERTINYTHLVHSNYYTIDAVDIEHEYKIKWNRLLKCQQVWKV
jgi:hypothetical protein